MACEQCYSGYTWTPMDLGDDRCYRTLEQDWNEPSQLVSLTAVTSTEFSTQNGQLITDYNISGTPISYYTLTSTTLWVNSGFTITDGALNRAGVWADLECTAGDALPLNLWIGFSICLGDVLSAKTYYVGIAANDAYKINLDGITIVDTLLAYPTGNTTTYTTWRIYEIVVPQGDDHTLEIFGLNLGGNAVIGAEIYDNTLNEILTANTLGDLTVLYNTRDDESFVMTFQTLTGHYIESGYTCCGDYVVSNCCQCCKQYIVCGTEIIPSPSNTPTLTPTPTPTPSLINTSPYVSGCCDNILYKLASGGKYNVGSVVRVEPINFCFTVVPDTKYSSYVNLPDNLGVAYVSGCSSKQCQPCEYEPTSASTCDILTIPDLYLECNTIDPSYFNTLDGSVGLIISGGTAPYTVIWNTPYNTSVTALTLTNISGGSYTATVYDYYRDFIQSIVCTIDGPKDCDYEVDIVPYPCISPSPTKTPTQTPTMTKTPAPTVTPTTTPTPSTTGDITLVDCLKQIKVVIEYNHFNTGNGNTCGVGSHTCNSAVFNVSANNVILGSVSLNNIGGSYDLLNVPPTYNPLPIGWLGGSNNYNALPRSDYDRYGEIIINTTQAQLIAAQNPSGNINLTFGCGCVSNVNCAPYGGGTGCHTGLNYTRVYKDNVLIFSGCASQSTVVTISACTQV